jgi:membrane associated rhomboid family serine protease
MKPVTLLLIFANLAVFGFELAAGGQPVYAYGLVPAHVVPSALISSLFLHDPSTFAHLGGNMVFLAIFGTLVEKELGGALFLALYLVAGVSGGFMHVMANPVATAPLVGASGAIFGVMAVAGALRPSLLAFVLAFASINVWHAFTGADGSVSFGAHIGGFVAGFLFVWLLRATEALEVA